jgi:hypothetical protein
MHEIKVSREAGRVPVCDACPRLLGITRSTWDIASQLLGNATETFIRFDPKYPENRDIALGRDPDQIPGFRGLSLADQYDQDLLADIYQRISDLENNLQNQVRNDLSVGRIAEYAKVRYDCVGGWSRPLSASKVDAWLGARAVRLYVANLLADLERG